MTTETQETGPGDVARIEGPPQAISPQLIEAYAAMIADVPDAGGDAFESILGAIARTTNPADLDAPWRSGGLDEWIGERLAITGIRKMPSDYPGGLPWFLVVDAIALDTGEVMTLTAGAVSVVAQLAKWWQLGGRPMVVIPRQSERPSKSGYYPQHLEIVGPYQPAEG